MRWWALFLILITLCGCPQTDSGTGAPARGRSGNESTDTGESARSTAAWLDPEAKINSAVRLTSPAGIDVRQAAYWQPSTGEGKPAPPLKVLLRTRDYNARTEGAPDPQRVAVLNLESGETAKLDGGITGLPIRLAVSPNHRYGVIAFLESQGKDKGYSLQAVDLRAYGYSDKPVELRPQPSVEPYAILEDGDVLCRIVRGIVVVNGLPAVGYDWLSGTQLCDVSQQSFSALDDPALPSPDGRLRSGYSVNYDPALPQRGRITYWLGDGGRDTARWELAYYGGSAPFDWAPPVKWLSAGSVATVSYRAKALGEGAGLFRIVSLEADGEARLIEDRATPDVTLVAANGVLLYPMRGGAANWSLWASSADGLDKQRVWTTSETVFLEVLDIVDGRRMLIHRQYFGEDSKLHSELLELSLDPLQATKGKPAPKEITPLSEPKAIIEEAEPQREQPAPEAPPDDLFPPDPPGDGGFIPDLPPGDGPPPISG